MRYMYNVVPLGKLKLSLNAMYPSTNLYDDPDSHNFIVHASPSNDCTVNNLSEVCMYVLTKSRGMVCTHVLLTL